MLHNISSMQTKNVLSKSKAQRWKTAISTAFPQYLLTKQRFLGIGLLCAFAALGTPAFASKTFDATPSKEHAMGKTIRATRRPDKPSLLTLADSRTSGFKSLVMDYEGVREKMRQDIKQGQGAVWASWMRQGITHHDALFYWLLGDWHWQMGNKDQAYITTVQAMMLSQTENALCGARSSRGKFNATDHLLFLHKDIINYKPHQQTIITSIYRGGKLLDSVTSPSGQTCFLSHKIAGKDPNKIDARGTLIAPAAFAEQAISVKKSMDYQKAAQNTSLQEIIHTGMPSGK